MKTTVKLAHITLLAVLALAACGVSVNEDVIIPAGSANDSGANTVNGDIVIGADSTSDGSFKTVNGSITVQDGATVQNIASVNGAIVVGARAKTGSIEGVNGKTDCETNARIEGDIKLVNGAVNVKNGASVSGSVKTVNGRIRLEGATVEGSVKNFHGGIVITDSSLVKGDVIVAQPVGESIEKPPVVIIGPGSRVQGKLRFERPVKLYVHEMAEIGSGIVGAEPIIFSGDRLPEDG